MGKQAFTPGPWHVAPGDALNVFDGQHAKPIRAPTQADAKLIAAAPELHEALDFVRKYAELRANRGDALPSQLMSAVLSALSKATGAA